MITHSNFIGLQRPFPLKGTSGSLNHASKMHPTTWQSHQIPSLQGSRMKACTVIVAHATHLVRCDCQQTVLADSLIMSCIDILSHLRKSCSSVYPYISHSCTSIIKCSLMPTISNTIYWCFSLRCKYRWHFSHWSFWNMSLLRSRAVMHSYNEHDWKHKHHCYWLHGGGVSSKNRSIYSGGLVTGDQMYNKPR